MMSIGAILRSAMHQRPSYARHCALQHFAMCPPPAARRRSCRASGAGREGRDDVADQPCRRVRLQFPGQCPLDRAGAEAAALRRGDVAPSRSSQRSRSHRSGRQSQAGEIRPSGTGGAPYFAALVHDS